MPYYHSTTVDRLASIARYGLGGVDTGPRSEACARGVYLAEDPRTAVAIALMHYLNTGAATGEAPAAALAAVRVLVVDDTRLDRRRLRPDPQVRTWPGAWLYDGVVDVTSAPVLTVDAVLAGCPGLGLPTGAPAADAPDPGIGGGAPATPP